MIGEKCFKLSFFCILLLVFISKSEQSKQQTASADLFTSDNLENIIKEAENGDSNNELFNIIKTELNEDTTKRPANGSIIKSIGSIVNSFVPERVSSFLKSIDNSVELTDKLKKFRKFMFDYKKSYNVTEIPHRLKLFVERLRDIQQSEQDYAAGKSSYEIGLNEYSDLHDDEVVKVLKGKRNEPVVMAPYYGGKYNRQRNQPRASSTKSLGVPDSLDLRDTGCITPVRDQKKCGSCYAFAVLGVIEALHCSTRGSKVVLAPQQVIDCGQTRRTKGCDGGFEGDVIDYLNRRGEIALESSYPYTGKESGRCEISKSSKNTIKASVTETGKPIRYKDIYGHDEMIVKLNKFGPLIAAMEAENRNFLNYKRGIYTNNKCSRPSTIAQDHAIMLVGYGEENEQKYWLVKNSWGDSWGENGFGKIKRGANECSIESKAIVVFNN